MSRAKIKARIAGTGMFVPPKILRNVDLEALMDTSDEWIRQRSGIEERHVIEAGTGTSDLAVAAAHQALLAAGCNASDIELIIVATLSPDHQFPGTSALVQHKLGLETTPSMDLRCQCSGFLYALNVGKLFIEAGQYKRILIIGAEAHSPLLDWTTRGRDVAVLFGDGAGAVVLEADLSSKSEIGSFALHSQGQFADRLWVEKPGTSKGVWLTAEDQQQGRIFPIMEGRYVFKHAVERLIQVIKEVLDKEGKTLESIDHFLFHQANIRINEKVADTLKIPAHKIHSNIQRYGNCSAASIPILMDETIRMGKIKRGETMLLAAFGAGFTWAGGIAVY
ncbi:MAG: ketoacyl-ACP synthase III [Proteobacteria bacterium]|nr:ketoacyl-ACP synthase III [Pseudomonadota bacterium]